MNEVNARRDRLVLGWVTIFGRVYHLGMMEWSLSGGVYPGADFSFFVPEQRTNSLPPSPSLPPFTHFPFLSCSSPITPSPPLRPLPSEVGPLNTAGGLGAESAASCLKVRQFWLIFLRTNVIFCTKTSLISYGGSNSSQGGASYDQFFSWGSRRRCPMEVAAPMGLIVAITALSRMFFFYRRPADQKCRRLAD